MDEEIKNTLWSLKPFKSPGPHGIHASFYQRFWLLVKDFVIKEIKKVFNDRKVPAYLNQTHITFIPKIKGPKTIGNYRLISLCNSVYKIISKILVTRIRPYLDKLISPFQIAFVLGQKVWTMPLLLKRLSILLVGKGAKWGIWSLKLTLRKPMIDLKGP